MLGERPTKGRRKKDWNVHELELNKERLGTCPEKWASVKWCGGLSITPVSLTCILYKLWEVPSQRETG